MTQRRLAAKKRRKREDILYLHPAVSQIDVQLRMRRVLHHIRKGCVLDRGATLYQSAGRLKNKIPQPGPVIGIKKPRPKPHQLKTRPLGKLSLAHMPADGIGTVT